MLKVLPFHRTEWTALPHDGCYNVSTKALARFPQFALALLKFEPNGTIHEHSPDFPIDVICLEGEGEISLGDEQATIKAGERVRWMAGVKHKLWTTNSTMITLMVEHQPST